MPEQIYNVVSGIMRYVFVALGCLIVLRAFLWLRKDRRETEHRLRRLPDAGMIGEFVVLYGNDSLPEGTSIPVPREGVLGFVRGADIALPFPGIKRYHLDFSFENGTGLLISPRSGCEALADGIPVNCRTNPALQPLVHGSTLQIGQLLLRLRLFAGVNIERTAAYAPEEMSFSPQIPVSPPPAAFYSGEPIFPIPQPPFPEYTPVGDNIIEPTSEPEKTPIPSTRRVRRSDRWDGDWSE